jgi:2-polyprenyl-3-methyl-5-hydroxy-6-metoxy-1,4-benzoquinol methylase
MMKEQCPLCKSKNIKFKLKDYKKNDYWECLNCELLFQNPITKYSYNENYWTSAIDPDGKEKDQTIMREFKIKNWYGEISKFVKEQKPGKIFDVGCGLGYLLSDLPKTWQKFGSDASKFATSFIEKNYEDITLKELDLTNPPPENLRGFDVVVCYHVIEHIEEPTIFFKHLSMMVKKNGILIVGTPNVGSFVAKRFKENFRLLGIGHLSLFNKNNLKRLFRKNNFKIIKEEYPFLKTDYFNIRNIFKIINTKKISPPFYGNIITLYGKNSLET